MLDPDGREVMRIFDGAFQEYGLPCRIRSDNGPPFATVGAAPAARVSVVAWSPISTRPRAKAFDGFRRIYNDERPQQALGQHAPLTFFAVSPRRYPRRFVRFEPDPRHQPMRVDKSGFIPWDKKRIFISTALAHEDVELRYSDDAQPAGPSGTWSSGPLSIGTLKGTRVVSCFAPRRGGSKRIVRGDAIGLKIQLTIG